MSDDYGFDVVAPQTGGDFPEKIERTRRSVNGLGISATAFAAAMTRAFTEATTGGKKFDEVLKSLALRLSAMTVAAAFRPLAKSILGGIGDIFGGGTTGGPSGGPLGGMIMTATGGITPFAAGGVIGTPSYFPLSSNGLGLAGEAGPEAIVPLARGRDGRLGIAMAGGASSHITVQIATPDAGSFRRSEAYITGQIARAVARGQRSF